jgi:hypothetical protein
LAPSSKEAFLAMQEEAGKGWWDGKLVEEFRRMMASS